MKTYRKTGNSYGGFTQAIQTRQRTARICILLGSMLSAAQIVIKAAPGDLDLSFDAGSTVNRAINAIVVQSDGKVLIGGGFTTVHGAMRTGLARLNPDGATDESFNVPLTGSAPTINAIVIQADGKVLIGGSFASVNGTGQSNLARLNLDYSLDLTYSNALSAVSLLALQKDGKLLVTGGFTNVNGVERHQLARLNGDGSLDQSFVNGLAGPVYSLAIQDDGKIVIAGDFGPANSPEARYLARLNQDGSLDDSFLTGMAGPDWIVRSVCLQPDGKILVGGFFDSFNGLSVRNIARLNADGSLDGTFLPEVWGYYFGLSRIIVQGDGKLLLGGRLTWNGGPSFPGVLRVNQDGSQDTSFTGRTQEFGELGGGIGALVLNGDGSILLAAGGDFSSPPRPFLVKLDSHGSRDVTFGKGPSGPDDEIHKLAIQSDGRVLLGGDFRTISGESRGGIARLNSDGSFDSSFLSGLLGTDGPVWDIALQSDGKCVIAGEFYSVNGITKRALARLNTDGSLDGSFLNTLDGPNQHTYALGVQEDGSSGKYLSEDRCGKLRT